MTRLFAMPLRWRYRFSEYTAIYTKAFFEDLDALLNILANLRSCH